MSWYGSDYPYRTSVAVRNDAAGGTYQVSIDLAPLGDEFWETVLANGYDLRLCTSDGKTVVAAADVKRVSWDRATRTGTVVAQTVSLAANKVTSMHLYWGYASASDAMTGAFATGSPKTGTVSPARPTGRVFQYAQEQPGTTRPRAIMAKMASEAVMIWVDFGPALLKRRGVSHDRNRFDEIASLDISVATGGADQTTMYDEAENVLVGDLVGVLVKAGTTGTDYVVIVTITTSEGYTYIQHVKLQVRNTSEA